MCDYGLTVAAWSRCAGRQVMGHCRLAGSAFSVWFPSRAVLMGGGIPNKWLKGSQLPLDSSIQIPDRERLSCMSPINGYPDEANSLGPPSLEGWQFCWLWQWRVSMRLMGSCNICCTPSQVCSAPSEGG